MWKGGSLQGWEDSLRHCENVKRVSIPLSGHWWLSGRVYKQSHLEVLGSQFSSPSQFLTSFLATPIFLWTHPYAQASCSSPPHLQKSFHLFYGNMPMITLQTLSAPKTVPLLKSFANILLFHLTSHSPSSLLNYLHLVLISNPWLTLSSALHGHFPTSPA